MKQNKVKWNKRLQSEVKESEVNLNKVQLNIETEIIWFISIGQEGTKRKKVGKIIS